MEKTLLGGRGGVGDGRRDGGGRREEEEDDDDDGDRNEMREVSRTRSPTTLSSADRRLGRE